MRIKLQLETGEQRDDQGDVQNIGIDGELIDDRLHLKLGPIFQRPIQGRSN